MIERPYGRPMGPSSTDHLTALAEAVITEGFAAHRSSLADLVSRARQLGVCAVLTDVLADEAAPGPVRERALGRVIVALVAIAGAPSALATAGAGSAA